MSARRAVSQSNDGFSHGGSGRGLSNSSRVPMPIRTSTARQITAESSFAMRTAAIQRSIAAYNQSAKDGLMFIWSDPRGAWKHISQSAAGFLWLVFVLHYILITVYMYLADLSIVSLLSFSNKLISTDSVESPTESPVVGFVLSSMSSMFSTQDQSWLVHVAALLIDNSCHGIIAALVWSSIALGDRSHFYSGNSSKQRDTHVAAATAAAIGSPIPSFREWKDQLAKWKRKTIRFLKWLTGRNSFFEFNSTHSTPSTHAPISTEMVDLEAGLQGESKLTSSSHAESGSVTSENRSRTTTNITSAVSEIDSDDDSLDLLGGPPPTVKSSFDRFRSPLGILRFFVIHVKIHWRWILAATLTSCLLDIDHFIAAGSLKLSAATTLRSRPFGHSVTFVVAITAVVQFCLSPLWRHRGRASICVLVSLLSHLLRDSIRRGLWFWPFGTTPALPFALVTVLCLPLMGFLAWKSLFLLPHHTQRSQRGTTRVVL